MNRLAEDLDYILAHTEPLWDDLRGQRLFITGGTGFFGCWLLESFAWANDRLGLDANAVVLTRNPGEFQRKAPHLVSHPAIDLYLGDVQDFAFPAGHFSHVIHAAAEVGAASQGDAARILDTIVGGTRRTLEFAGYCQAEKLLLVSSGAVYGRQSAELSHVSEAYFCAPDVMDPRSAYGEGKRVAELLSTIYGGIYGFEVKVARCFSFVGPYMPLNAHFAIGNFVRDGLQGGPIRICGEGTSERSYLYAADLVIWLWTILLRGKSNYPYNVGSEKGIAIRSLAHLVSEAFGFASDILVREGTVESLSASRYVPNVERAMLDLELRCEIDIVQSIQKSIVWFSGNHSFGSGVK